MRLFLFAVYLAVTLVCVGISGVALYEGAFPLLGWPAIPIAVAVALVLLAFDIVLRAQIRSGGRWLRVVGALIVVAALSWTFLFTTFYSAAMRDDVVAARLEEASARFDQNIATARGAVQSAAAREGLQERHRRARELFEEMQRQALDRQNCGVGRETREYRDAIDKLLEVPITNLKPPAGCQAGEIRAWIEDVRGAMEGRIAREVEKDSFVIATKFLDGALAKKNELVSSGAGASYIRQRAIIEALIDLTRQVEVKVNEALAPTKEKVTLAAVKTERDRLRNITEVLDSAFVERPNFGMTIYAALFALMIDLFPMIVAFVLFRREREDRLRTPFKDSGRDLRSLSN